LRHIDIVEKKSRKTQKKWKLNKKLKTKPNNIFLLKGYQEEQKGISIKQKSQKPGFKGLHLERNSGVYQSIERKKLLNKE